MSISNHSTYVGLDVHKNSINVAMQLPGSTGIAHHWQQNADAAGISRLVKKLKRLAVGTIRVCYEAGPCGYTLQRTLQQKGIECTVIAPSLIPTKPGDRVKTDRRDATRLAQLFAAGLLTAVHPPDEQFEVVRDLCRLRDAVRSERMGMRQRTVSFLLRHGIVYREGNHWTKKHQAWLHSIRFGEPIGQLVLEQQLLSIQQADDRLHVLDDHIEELSQQQRWAAPVAWLRCLRGIDTLTAMTIVSKVHDIRRFAGPDELMGYFGLVGSEYSSGEKIRKGSITKAGDKLVRRLLVEAAQHCRRRPHVSKELRARRQGQPAAVIAIADKAMGRLYRKYHRMLHSGKNDNVAKTAVARELVGFIWAIMYHEQWSAS